MTRFYVNHRDLVQAAALPDEQYFFDVVLLNNEKATAWNDRIHDRLVVECENKPRDMTLFGIVWKEDKP